MNVRPCCDNCKHYGSFVKFWERRYCFHPATSLNPSEPFQLTGRATNENDVCKRYEKREEGEQ